ncbi:hypothetical protein H0H81_010595 [Sphagnurus paluster]|uniref:Uncharacterized protein n=1 Tax=Sphagnurus paluster TaxID=117069 RepID=A0A9P7K2I3_9AGAR|nr:hypothetical protein H0H81_010595 [Sphagnurus paluster]
MPDVDLQHAVVSDPVSQTRIGRRHNDNDNDDNGSTSIAQREEHDHSLEGRRMTAVQAAAGLSGAPRISASASVLRNSDPYVHRGFLSHPFLTVSDAVARNDDPTKPRKPRPATAEIRNRKEEKKDGEKMASVFVAAQTREIKKDLTKPTPVADHGEYEGMERRGSSLLGEQSASYTAPKRAAESRKFIDFVRSDLDWYSPFRQLGPSLSLMVQPGGPYSPEHLRTPAGLFSALVFRGVTHHTPYLLDGHPVFFEDLAAWERTYSKLYKLKTDHNYFCNRRAYGSAAAAREVGNIPRYWEQANDPQFNFFLTSKTPANILTLFNRFLKPPTRKKDERLDPNTDNRFRAFGPLTLLQLLVDYAQAGVTTKPTAEEMAYMIHKVNEGGSRGLLDLDYHVQDRDTLKDALVDLHQRLLLRIPKEIQHMYDFDFIFMEHALCKHGRLAQRFETLYCLLKLS